MSAKRRIPDDFQVQETDYHTTPVASNRGSSAFSLTATPGSASTPTSVLLNEPSSRKRPRLSSASPLKDEVSQSTTGPSFFHNASFVNANNGFFNAVGGDQHINITPKTDSGTVELSPLNRLSHLQLLDRKRRAVTAWLSPLNFRLIHNEIFQIREEGTGQWLIDSETFKAWRDGHSDILWCPGNREASSLVDAQKLDLANLSNSGCWKDYPHVCLHLMTVGITVLNHLIRIDQLSSIISRLFSRARTSR